MEHVEYLRIAMRNIIVIDQYALTPYALQQSGMSFAALLAAVLTSPEVYTIGDARRPEVLVVAETYIPPLGMYAIAANEEGMPFVWKSRWTGSD